MFVEVQSAHVGRESTLGLLRQRIEGFMAEMQLRSETHVEVQTTRGAYGIEYEAELRVGIRRTVRIS